MKKSFGYFLLALTVVACSNPDDMFRLKGKFKNFNQGELAVFNQMGRGSVDTIRLADGKFTYDLPLLQADTVVLSVVFPNYTIIPVIAAPGFSLTMEGDASHLREVKVTGNDDNDQLTQFRLEVGGKTPPEAEKVAEKFIKEHPASPACLYILNKYFLLKTDADYNKASTLLQLIVKANPNQRLVKRVQRQIDQLRDARKGKKLPAFTAISTTGARVTNADLSGELNVVYLWSSWSYESQSLQRQLHRLKRNYGSRLQLIGLCIDANPEECKSLIERDSIKWYNVCDGKMWQTPAVAKLGFSAIPDNILIDRSGRILERGLSTVDLQKKIEEKLK